MLVPDVPLAIIFLILYLVFGVIHIKIFKGNKHRGHKFIFNGAILGMQSPPPPGSVVRANTLQVSARFESSPCPCG
jgi:hypothetical protein